MWRVNLKNIGATLKFKGAKTAPKISALSQMAPFFIFLFLALLILFFVIFLFTPLSALLRDFVPYSRVVTCNYVITSTSILFKALFYSKVANNRRRSPTETFLLNFLSFLRQKLSILAFFNSLRSCLLWVLDCESFLILLARCTFVGLRDLVTILYFSNNFIYIYLTFK